MSISQFFRRHRAEGAPGDPYFEIDRAYRGMYASHEVAHKGMVAEIAALRTKEGLEPRVLEIACGIALNAPGFTAAGIDYCGLDISETAITLAARRHPSASFINIAAADLRLLASDSWDIIYCSSMLEHIGEYEAVLADFVRITRRHLFVLFYEGLHDGPAHEIRHNQLDQWRGNDLSAFGVKFISYLKKHNGWFMNRYAREPMVAAATRAGARQVEILDRTNRDFFLRNESVMHVSK